MGLFKKATKKAARGRVALAGPSGSGKTYTALMIAQGLGGPIAFLDTERGSASKYANLFDFDVVEMMPPYHPERFVKVIAEAVKAGYKVLVIDSISHAWNGSGGLLELVDAIAKKKGGGNSFTAWKDATPIQTAFIDAMVGAGLHLVATMRSKQEYVMEEKTNRNGRTTNVPKKVGMAPVQREGMEYEFDILIDMDLDHNAVVSKSRCPELADGVFNKPGKELGEAIGTWLSDGAKPAEDPAAAHAGTCTNKPSPASQPTPEDPELNGDGSAEPDPGKPPRDEDPEGDRLAAEAAEEAKRAAELQRTADDARRHADDEAREQGNPDQAEQSGTIEESPEPEAGSPAAKACKWLAKFGITRSQVETAFEVPAARWSDPEMDKIRAARDAADGKPAGAMPAFLKSQLGIG